MPLKRKTGSQPSSILYRKNFIISTEGYKTEPQYFSLFKGRKDLSVTIRTIGKKSKSSPFQVLKSLESFLKKKQLKGLYEAWLVVDKDQWPDKQLKSSFEWSDKREHCYFALSNPNFELWLLLHFEEVKEEIGKEECVERLKKHIPNYDKSVDKTKISQEMINTAVKRAKEKDKPPCKDWPRKTGTTVYRLVGSIESMKKS